MNTQRPNRFDFFFVRRMQPQTELTSASRPQRQRQSFVPSALVRPRFPEASGGAVMFAIWRLLSNPITKKGSYRGFGLQLGRPKLCRPFSIPPSLEPIVYHRLLRCAAELGTFRVVIARGHAQVAGGFGWWRRSPLTAPSARQLLLGRRHHQIEPVGSPQRSADGCRGSPK